MKVTVLCPDLSSNALGRADLLAGALAGEHEVELLGPARGELWPPLPEPPYPIRSFPWTRYPGFARVRRELLDRIDGEVILACKLRPTSYGIALSHKRRHGTPVIVDIDDWELGFYLRKRWPTRVGQMLNLTNPDGMAPTWAMERRLGAADAVLVSNTFLQARFGGEIVYHCRDTAWLDPERVDGRDLRRRLGLEGMEVVLFLGTPRAHKGLEWLLAAFAALPRPNARLLIAGAPEGFVPPSTAGLDSRRVHVEGPVPFAQRPAWLAAADVVVVPQPRSPATAGQMPAKLFDAMAMARPIIASPVSDIPRVLGDGGYLVEPGDVDGLTETLAHVLTHPEEARARARQARARCRARYDTRVLAERMDAVVRDIGCRPSTS